MRFVTYLHKPNNSSSGNWENTGGALFVYYLTGPIYNNSLETEKKEEEKKNTHAIAKVSFAGLFYYFILNLSFHLIQSF